MVSFPKEVSHFAMGGLEMCKSDLIDCSQCGCQKDVAKRNREQPRMSQRHTAGKQKGEAPRNFIQTYSNIFAGRGVYNGQAAV